MIKCFQLTLGALLAAAVFWPSSASACSCAVEGSFEEVSSKAQTVIRAKVLDYVPVGDAQPQNLPPVAMSVEVLEQVKGKVEAKQIVLWGDNGMQCRPYLDQFLVGTEWLFAKGLQTSIAL